MKSKTKVRITHLQNKAQRDKGLCDRRGEITWKIDLVTCDDCKYLKKGYEFLAAIRHKSTTSAMTRMRGVR